MNIQKLISTNIFLLLLFFIQVSIGFAQTTAIKAGHVINPADGFVKDNQIIPVKNGRIEKIGSNIEVGKAYSVVDLSDRGSCRESSQKTYR